MVEQREAFVEEFNQLLEKYRGLCPGVRFNIRLKDCDIADKYEGNNYKDKVEFRF